MYRTSTVSEYELDDLGSIAEKGKYYIFTAETMDTEGSFLQVKLPGNESDPSPQSNDDIKNG
jgi:hypothetical protein